MDGDSFPTLEAMMGLPPAKPREQTDDEMLDVMLSWRAVMEGTFGEN